MSIVVVGILALAALAYVAAALDRPQGAASGLTGAAEVELERRARAALVAIVDLENERDVGKLTAQDFDDLVGTYEDEALTALRALDDVRSAGASDAVERDIAAVRARLRTRPPGAGSSEPR
jgi:hypothetical protein